MKAALYHCAGCGGGFCQLNKACCVCCSSLVTSETSTLSFVISAFCSTVSRTSCSLVGHGSSASIAGGTGGGGANGSGGTSSSNFGGKTSANLSSRNFSACEGVASTTPLAGALSGMSISSTASTPVKPSGDSTAVSASAFAMVSGVIAPVKPEADAGHGQPRHVLSGGSLTIAPCAGGMGGVAGGGGGGLGGRGGCGSTAGNGGNLPCGIQDNDVSTSDGPRKEVSFRAPTVVMKLQSSIKVAHIRSPC